MKKELKVNEVYQTLYENYGKQGWWPIINSDTFDCEYHVDAPKNSKDRFEIILGVILTQNTSFDPNVVNSIVNLKKKFGNNLFENIKKINDEKLSELIKPSGYYNQKTKKIREYIKFIETDLDVNRRNLLSVWGIGKESADSILCYAYKKPVFVVDSYTVRIFSRIYNKEFDYDSLQEFVSSNLNKTWDVFSEFHALLVEHAKKYCKKKPDCINCPIRAKCSYYKLSEKA